MHGNGGGGGKRHGAGEAKRRRRGGKGEGRHLLLEVVLLGLLIVIEPLVGLLQSLLDGLLVTAEAGDNPAKSGLATGNGGHKGKDARRRDKPAVAGSRGGVAHSSPILS